MALESVSSVSDLRSALPAVQRRAMAKAITLLESTRADHRAQADDLLTTILPHTGESIRVGISGVPGVGKSTLIEALGLQARGGVVRVSIAHYNTPAEMEHLITHLDAAIDAALDTNPALSLVHA